MTESTPSTCAKEDNASVTALPDIPPVIADLKASNKTSTSYKHTFPVHTKLIPSPLSKEAPPESYRGFVNLGMLLLFGNNIRLIIENYLKYGFLISFPGSNVSKQDWILAAITTVILPLNVMLAYKLEHWAMENAIGFRKRKSDDAPAEPPKAVAAGDNKDEKKNKKQPKTKMVEELAKENQSTVGWLHVANLFFIIAWPSFMSFYIIYHPFVAMACLMNGIILFLKMTSFALVNQDLRAAFIFGTPIDKFKHLTTVHDVSGKDITKEEVFQYDVHYPGNITLKNIGYFWLAPTLCYQPSYPRTTVFRKSFFFKRVLEIITCLGMMYFLVEQYATPTLQNSVRAFDELAFGTILERVLKLSTTSVIIWLLMFYTFFHSFFNALAEVLYFGDRRFYLAWWNATGVGMYWKTWNSPVYTFFKRHVYLPLITSGTSPMVASIVIFFISAVLHEVLIGFPTHMIYGYAFAGMFLQIPLIALTKPLEKWRGAGSGLGNMIFWLSFTILGQPACALLYYYHWTKRHIDE
ncbi:hypothetical protein BG011_004786 [Mortierella polycephala]|uniref:O-acyltransferase n=1 Tax=Mortierella polycephala TaxID=41804 RepID=A0A9P6QEJ9_9FUNG|nr:hypothetical protein BG011_004786 [Mortierella polycephala]